MSARRFFTRALATATLAAASTTVGMAAANAADMHYVYWEPTHFHCQVTQWSVLSNPDTTLAQDCTPANDQWYFTTIE